MIPQLQVSDMIKVLMRYQVSSIATQLRTRFFYEVLHFRHSTDTTESLQHSVEVLKVTTSGKPQQGGWLP